MANYERLRIDGIRSGVQPIVKTQHCPNCESQAAEIERLQVEAKVQFDRGYYDGCANPIVRYDALREALRNIQIEAEREKGSWVHLKRVIALNCKAALEQAND